MDVEVNERWYAALSTFLEDGGPNSSGEWGMHCPLPDHEDQKRSASVNFEKGVWFCQVCDNGGPVEQIVKLLETEGHTRTGVRRERSTNKSKDLDEISDEEVLRWNAALLNDEDGAMRSLMGKRGIKRDTASDHMLGWSSRLGAYTIPVSDTSGEWTNVRFYDPNPDDDRRKIWSIEGRGAPSLYPIGQLDSDGVIICEGEWDAMLTIQNGFAAITRTGAAKVWKPEWNKFFAGKTVWIIHDMDDAGQAANLKVAAELKNIAEVFIVKLPYEVVEKNGRDLTDYWLDGYTAEDLMELLDAGQLVPGDPEDLIIDTPPIAVDTETPITVLDSYNASNYGKKLRMKVTVVGKKYPTYLVPEQVHLECDQDAGPKCSFCPMNNNWSGQHDFTIDAGDPVNLQMIGSTAEKLHDILRTISGVPQKCPRLLIAPTVQRSIEELFVRSDIDESRLSTESGDYTPRKIVSVGRHDTQHNQTVETVGAIWPNPRDQSNEYLAWNLVGTRSSVDSFVMDDEIRASLEIFQTSGSPLRKAVEIAKEYETYVTRIYGRLQMHVLMDLVFHSVIGFTLKSQPITKGWLDVLVVGDTRTGKSEAAVSLLRHYMAGEFVSCESTSFAGVVGGLEQFSGKEWAIKWGVIPQNDRRLVVLDEVSGMKTEDIAAMSSIRSSGEAQITKIHSERTLARTRLIFMGNPRDGRKMSGYTYGAQAIQPLIGNPEDIARFDLAMSVASADVSSDIINMVHEEFEMPIYTSGLGHNLVMWVWSRKPEHVVFDTGVEGHLLTAATDLGSRYIDQPPLIQAANVRVKLARVAVALAARTFNTPDGEHVLVERRHIDDAVKFMDGLYGMKGFGYKEVSEEIMEDTRTAIENQDIAQAYLESKPGLAKFLRAMGVFQSRDLQDMLNWSRDEASATISHLWQMRMVRREGAEVHLNPALHEVLRKVKE